MKFKSVLRRLLTENLDNKKLIALYDKFIAPAETGSDEKLKKALNLKIKNLETNKEKVLTPLQVFARLIKMDPTTKPDNFDWSRVQKKEDLNNIKIGQYLNWLMRTFILAKELDNPYEPGTKEYEDRYKLYQKEIFEDEDMIKGLLDKFFKYQKRIPEDKRNIMNIDGVQELMDLPVRATTGNDTVRLIEYEGKLVSKALAKGEGEDLSPESPRVRFSYPGSEILKVGSDYTLVKIPAGGELGQKAASFFGGYHLGSSSPSSNESNWCTSPDNSHNFRNYIQQGPLYILLANNDKGEKGIKSGLPKERYQIHFGSYRQFKDRLNGNIDFVKDLAGGKFSEFKDFFKNEFIKGVGSSSFSTNKGNLEGEFVIKVNNPNPTATSDYIKIYGESGLQKDNPTEMLREQLINLPTSCTAIKITNDTKEDLSLEIPNEILKFKNLKTLNITKLAKTLPQDFSGFSKLRFLSLIDNKQLTTLPEGLENLPLVFINLMGSDAIKFPNQEKRQELENIISKLEELKSQKQKDLEGTKDNNKIADLEIKIEKIEDKIEETQQELNKIKPDPFLENFEQDSDENYFWTPK